MEIHKTVKGISKEYLPFYHEINTGYKAECCEGWDRVVEIWCKICKKNKPHLLAALKGAAVNSAKACTKGTNNVTKDQVLAVFFFFSYPAGCLLFFKHLTRDMVLFRIFGCIHFEDLVIFPIE